MAWVLMINGSTQHYINVMRGEVLKMNELDINKHWCKLKVKCLEPRTTLILYVVAHFEKLTAIIKQTKNQL